MVAEGGVPLLNFDLDLRQLLPRQWRGEQEEEEAPRGPAPQRGARSFAPSDAAAAGGRSPPAPHEQLGRTEIWAKLGDPMHYLTLEFSNSLTESEFSKDATRRTKRWCSWGLLIACSYYILVTVVRLGRLCFIDDAKSAPEDWVGVCDSATAALLYFLQFCQLHYDREFVLRNFQEVLFLWAVFHISLSLLWTMADARYVAKRSYNAPEGPLATTLVITLVTFKLRFIYYLILALYGLLGYLFLVDAMGVYLVTVIVGMTLLSYRMEVMQRKDFAQGSMAWKESRRSDLLLNNILPARIVSQLKVSPRAIARSYEQATVLFADVVSFTTMSAQITPLVLVDLLNRMFRKFDDLATRNEMEKIKTIGDCYMAVAGLPLANEFHAQTVARFGLQMLSVVGSGQLRNPVTDMPIQVRVGMHSGPCVAGVIGHKKFAYDVWGDAVNTASRMESHGEPMRLHCSEDTYNLLREDFVCEAREPMYVKGKGQLQTYFVISETQVGRCRSFISIAG